MQALIDADVLRYEIGFAAESGWKNPGFPHFDYVAELLDNKINNICAITECDQPPILYITGKTNFRTEIAKYRPYKQRAGNKPWHFNNITAYMKCKYDVRIQEGLEADDLMSIEQTSRPEDTIICSRDKDLRTVPGNYFSWELGNQPQFGPIRITELGTLDLSACRKKLKGTGNLFFYAQCLTGDSVDTVPGLPKTGPVKAFEILSGSQSIKEAFDRVLEAYRAHYGGLGDDCLLEQGRLLWMTRYLHPDGSPVLWEFPIGN